MASRDLVETRMTRRLIVTGPLEALRALDPRKGPWAHHDAVRSCQIAPLDLVRSLTPRDEIVLLPGWPHDRDASSVVAIGLWLNLTFYRVLHGFLHRCTPRSPVLEFVDGLETALGPVDLVDDLWVSAE